MSWLEQHIQEFVIPEVGDFERKPLGFFTQEEMTVIKNAWRSAKKEAKHHKKEKILLPGRDVFVFEILARRENYPTLFIPECSRMTVNYLKIPNLEDYFLIDTGFAGSIPNALGMKNFSLLSWSGQMMMSMESHRLNRKVSKQIFPRLTFSRGLALKIEQTPKYWESARMGENNEIIQGKSHHWNFVEAAQLTIEVYTNSSPKFINHNRPMSNSERRWY